MLPPGPIEDSRPYLKEAQPEFQSIGDERCWIAPRSSKQPGREAELWVEPRQGDVIDPALGELRCDIKNRACVTGQVAPPLQVFANRRFTFGGTHSRPAADEPKPVAGVSMLAKTEPTMPASVRQYALGRSIIELDEFREQMLGCFDLAKLESAFAPLLSAYRIMKQQPLAVQFNLRGSRPGRYRSGVVHAPFFVSKVHPIPLLSVCHTRIILENLVSGCQTTKFLRAPRAVGPPH